MLGSVTHIPEKSLYDWVVHYQISYVKVCGGHISSQQLLKCFHEEADDRLLIYVNYDVRVKNQL